MTGNEWLAERFEEQRPRLHAVAHRMLGSPSEAEDAVQEAWLRLGRTGADDVDNLGGWLTTVVARICLNVLRSRATRREESLQARPAEPVAHRHGADPEREALLADSIGPALLVVLDTLAPAERVAFVLHDLFAVPFGEIAPIVDRTPAAARQLASRARRRVQGASPPGDADEERRRQIVRAFLAASRGGDFEALLALLDPDAALRADEAAVQLGAPEEVLGAADVAGTFSGRARGARFALVDGAAAWVWAPGGTPKVVFALAVEDGRIARIDMIADPRRLEAMEVVFPD